MDKKSTTIALMSDLPKFCPHCGTAIKGDVCSRYEFWDGVSMHCPRRCGFAYQFSSKENLLDLSKKNGDLAQYIV